MMKLISVVGNAIPRINESLSKVRENYQIAIFSLARTALLILILYFYCDKFLSLTINNIILLTDGISSFNNPDDYSLNHMSLSLGGLILFSFILARNEYINIFHYFFMYPLSVVGIIKKPIKLSGWREYVTTIFAIVMFLIGFQILPKMGFYIPEQIPLFFIGAGIVSAFVLYQGGIPDLLNTPFSIYRSRKDGEEIIRIIIQSLKYAMPILVFVYLCLNLAVWPQIESNLTQFFSISLTVIAVLWWIQYSREISNPQGQERQISSIGLLLLLPFFMYLLTQIMFLLHHPNQGIMERWNVDFEFMYEKNPFEINTWPIDVNDNVDSRWRFWGAAILNSARVTLLSIFLCTILGVIIGVTRLSSNKLASSLATVYVEIFRNLPLAVLLFLISSQMGRSLPLFIEEANIRGLIYYSNQGIFIPGIEFMRLVYAIFFLLLIKLYLTIGDRDGVDDSESGLRRRFKIWIVGFAVSLGLIFSGEITTPQYIKSNLGIPGTWHIDEDTGFEITVEFLAMILGLILFTASVVAEIVRGSIQSLPRGQVEASISLGLNPYQRLRLVVLPQALRSMIPLLNSQYMNVWKNSSLAMIVAYSDIYYVINVMMNNVGKLIPLFLILLLTYQFGSLIISAMMNLYNARVTKVKI
jgi:general L-amino acid transport system permease protein